MAPEKFIQNKAAEAIKALYGADVQADSLQVAVTRKEFEGDYTLVTFPLLKITHSAPDATGNAIGQWLVDNVPEIAAYNSVKGFLNLSFSAVYWDETFAEIAADGRGVRPARPHGQAHHGGVLLPEHEQAPPPRAYPQQPPR